MKNNRLTNNEIIELRETVERLRELASLQNASFSSNIKEDESIKKSIRPYMQWFRCEAKVIEKILDGQFNLINR